MILPGSDEERSMGAAERLRSALEKHRFVFEGARIPLTASLGVAIWPADGREPEALLVRRPTAPSTPPSRPAATAWWRPPAVPPPATGAP